MALSMIQRSDTHRASRAVNERDLLRDELINPVTHQGVRVAAANLHQHPRACDAPVEVRHQGSCDAFVAILVKVFHWCSATTRLGRRILALGLTAGS